MNDIQDGEEPRWKKQWNSTGWPEFNDCIMALVGFGAMGFVIWSFVA
jgi:hypothetical protein